MMSSTRTDLLQVIADLCRIDPKMRFGQLICNLASLVDLTPEATWTVEDGPLLAEARDHLESQILRLGSPTTHLPADPTRFELLAAIREYVDRCPGAPFGRVVADLVASSKEPMSDIDRAGAIWDVEDEELLATIRHHLASYSSPAEKDPNPAASAPTVSSDHPTSTNP
jgi:hypothetical protein